MMVGSQFSFLDRGGAAAPAGSGVLSGFLYWAFSSIPAGVFWSSAVVASFVWFLLNDQLHPAVIYCLKQFLTT
jgi:hypothetical protein